MATEDDEEEKKQKQKEYHRLRYERLKAQKNTSGNIDLLKKISSIVEEEKDPNEDDEKPIPQKIEEEEKEKSILDQIKNEKIPIAREDQLPQPDEQDLATAEKIIIYRFGKTTKKTAALMKTLIQEVYDKHDDFSLFKTTTSLDEKAFPILWNRLLELSITKTPLFEVVNNVIKCNFQQLVVMKYVLEVIKEN